MSILFLTFHKKRGLVAFLREALGLIAPGAPSVFSHRVPSMAYGLRQPTVPRPPQEVFGIHIVVGRSPRGLRQDEGRWARLAGLSVPGVVPGARLAEKVGRGAATSQPGALRVSLLPANPTFSYLVITQ